MFFITNIGEPMAELLFQSKQEKLSDGSPIIITKILGAIDGTTVRQFEDKLIGFFNQGVKNLILIFSDVKYINSTGMGLLVKLADKFQEGGGDIKLVGVPEKVIALFDMLGLLSLFKIYETEDDAIDSIPQGAGGMVDSVPAPVTAPAPPPPPPPSLNAPIAPPPPAIASAPVPAPAPVPVPAPAPAPMVAEPPALTPAPALATPDYGGFVIGADPSSQPVQASWPHTVNCGACGGDIEYPAPGNYKCPRCSSYVTVDDFGQQAVKASLSSHILEFRFPCHQTFIQATKASINALARQVGFTDVFCAEINEALDHAVQITIEKSKGNTRETFQMVGVADANEMIVGIKSLNPFLTQQGPRDPRLPAIARKVDRLEVFPLPNKGQLLKMTKKRK